MLTRDWNGVVVRGWAAKHPRLVIVVKSVLQMIRVKPRWRKTVAAHGAITLAAPASRIQLLTYRIKLGHWRLARVALIRSVVAHRREQSACRASVRRVFDAVGVPAEHPTRGISKHRDVHVRPPSPKQLVHAVWHVAPHQRRPRELVSEAGTLAPIHARKKSEFAFGSLQRSPGRAAFDEGLQNLVLEHCTPRPSNVRKDDQRFASDASGGVKLRAATVVGRAVTGDWLTRGANISGCVHLDHHVHWRGRAPELA
mmetsp:Transcript_49791/g.140879  ORF Transcript_49791/g.140879 Transcript_49791/m.140879 type:complete len:255 (+) Transcript_49791:334-1098(+)